MKKTCRMLLAMTIMAMIVAPCACKKAATVSEADVLGAWEVKSWTWDDSRLSPFNGDMLGTLTFSKTDSGRVNVLYTLTGTSNGTPITLDGDADLTDLPVITFTTYGYGKTFLGHQVFRGIVEDGGMLIYGEFVWNLDLADHCRLEAVNKQ